MDAALPMYFPPRDAVQGFWAALADLLRGPGDDVPSRLSWPEDYEAHWLQDDLLLSQTCGYPLTTLLAGKVQLVGSLAYAAPGVQGIQCRSQLLCRANDPRNELGAFAGSTLAFNDRHSQSGYNALRALIASSSPLRPFFGHSLETGAHAASIEAVRLGAADMAAIDPVSLAHWQRANPQHRAALRVFDQTAAYPGLPLITALQTPPIVLARLRAGLRVLCNDAAYAELRAPLLITGFTRTALTDYQVCLDMQALALSRGLPVL